MTHKERRDLNNKIHKKALKELLFRLYGQEDGDYTTYHHMEHIFFNLYDYMDESVKGFSSFGLRKKFDILETTFLITTASLRANIKKSSIITKDSEEELKYDWEKAGKQNKPLN